MVANGSLRQVVRIRYVGRAGESGEQKPNSFVLDISLDLQQYRNDARTPRQQRCLMPRSTTLRRKRISLDRRTITSLKTRKTDERCIVQSHATLKPTNR